MAVKLSEITDHKYIPNALDTLIVSDEDKRLLKSLCGAHEGKTLPPSRRLFDQGGFKTKTDSLVISLHGGPGVGKAFTTG